MVVVRVFNEGLQTGTWMVPLVDWATLMIPAVAIEVLPTIACVPSVELEIGLLTHNQQDSVIQGHVAIVRGEIC